MFRLLLFMHHIAFAPHALHHVALGLCMCRCDRSRGVGTEDQKEQIKGVFGGTQASSYKDANIVMIKESPGASHLILDFYFELISLC
jgi:hypothetical protein